jgi:leucyl-tRNA synthetase
MAESPEPPSVPPSETPPHRYTAALAGRIETAWQDRWEREGTFFAPNPVGELSAGFDKVADLAKLYVLDMFPYPSGDGLHVGHPLGYIGTDVYARYKRMTGHNVVHTMGFDAFGLPAEQYAVRTGRHPRATTESNIVTMRRQLRRLGLGHDSRRSIATMDEGYYRWTQWIFLQIFNSWYDTDVDGARPIDDLVGELDAGTREPGEGTNPTGRPWSALTPTERRVIVDNHRLAFVSEAPVNWCPGLGTVLSNEEVTAEGRSERGNFPVFRRPLKQWMLRITAYAERLLRDLDVLDWPEPIKLMQRNWIGRSEGARVTFPAARAGAPGIGVFTTRPDTLFGATYMVLAPEHPLVDELVAPAWPEGTPERWTGGADSPPEAIAAYRRQASSRSDVERQVETRDKTGVFIGSHAMNPATGGEIPVFVADYVLMGYGTGAIMAVPGQDERDWAFAEEFDLPIVRTVQPPAGWDEDAPFTGEGPAMNSANDQVSLDGLGVADAKRTIIDWLERTRAGVGTTSYKLRDWLFSRQRFWGEPFPIVFDPDDGLPRALPESMLPVVLPEVDDYSPKTFDEDDDTSEPEPPLSRAADWVQVKLDLGEGTKTYRRETNTMPNWAGSCWYELRYLDPHNDKAPVDPENEKYWMGPRWEGDCGGVDLYVGGAEHAVLHLLYARFWHKVLHDLGHVSSFEPYRRLFNQGLIQAYEYTDRRGSYVDAHDVTEREGAFWHAGEQVNQQLGRMGKSRRNAVAPDEMYESYGADTLRLYEMFTGPLDQSRPWDTKAVVGVYRLLQRIWRNIVDEDTGSVTVADTPLDGDTERLLHRTIAAVREGMEKLRFNVSIAKITELNNHLVGRYPNGGVPRAVAEPLVLLLAPLAPHVGEELWSRLGHRDSLATEPFPEADPAMLVDDTVEIPVQVNGRVRARINVPFGADAEAIEALARADAKVAELLADATVRKVVAVPGRLINFVVG